MTFLVAAALLFWLWTEAVVSLECADGYTCFVEGDIVWVKKDEGVIYGPTCNDQCNEALGENSVFYVCKLGVAAFKTVSEFSTVATGMGISCKQSGGCWNYAAVGSGLLCVTRGDDPSKNCYFPDEDEFYCDTAPGNGNCFGERYSTICPCESKPLDEACVWQSPPHFPSVPKLPTDDSGKTCIERINYWRKRACDEAWVECPPSGLPPMTECTCAHECANAMAEYDSNNGAHASYGRCGYTPSQGEGGGSSCAGVIDMFVSERSADSEGVLRCTGHCGPIVKHGCQTFYWGRAQDGTSAMYTLNWRSCPVDQSQEYCANPTANDCFQLDPDLLAPDKVPQQCGCYQEDNCDGTTEAPQTTDNPLTTDKPQTTKAPTTDSPQTTDKPQTTENPQTEAPTTDNPQTTNSPQTTEGGGGGNSKSETGTGVIAVGILVLLFLIGVAVGYWYYREYGTPECCKAVKAKCCDRNRYDKEHLEFAMNAPIDYVAPAYVTPAYVTPAPSTPSGVVRETGARRPPPRPKMGGKQTAARQWPAVSPATTGAKARPPPKPMVARTGAVRKWPPVAATKTTLW